MTETPPGAGRGHLAQALHLAELPLQRRRNRGRRHIRTRARIKRQHLNGRIVDLRQRRNRQLRVRDDAHQQNRGHQQRRRNRPQNKWARRTHGALLSPEIVVWVSGMPALEMSDVGLVLQLVEAAVGHHGAGRQFPCTAVHPLSVTPVFTVCISTWYFGRFPPVPPPLPLPIPLLTRAAPWPPPPFRLPPP